MNALEQESKIETLLIAGAIIPQLLSFVLGTSIDSLLLLRLSLVFVFLLTLFYLYRYKAVKSSVTLLLILLGIGFDFYFGDFSIVNYGRICIRIVFGTWLMYVTLKSFLVSKEFELIAFLSAFFLILNVLFFTSLTKEHNLQLILLFGSTFSLATIIYYENLWNAYSAIEKKWLTLCLLTLIIDVLILSKNIF